MYDYEDTDEMDNADKFSVKIEEIACELENDLSILVSNQDFYPPEDNRYLGLDEFDEDDINKNRYLFYRDFYEMMNYLD